MVSNLDLDSRRFQSTLDEKSFILFDSALPFSLQIATQEILVFWAQHFWDLLSAVLLFLELVVSVLAAGIAGYVQHTFVETKSSHKLSQSISPHFQNTFNFTWSIHN